MKWALNAESETRGMAHASSGDKRAGLRSIASIRQLVLLMAIGVSSTCYGRAHDDLGLAGSPVAPGGAPGMESTLARSELTERVRHALESTCPNADAESLASSVTNKVSLALGGGPYLVDGESIAAAAVEFLTGRTCEFTDPKLRLEDDLSWLLVLVIQDESTEADRAMLRDQIRRSLHDWIADFARKQAAILDLDAVKLEAHLLQACDTELEKRSVDYVSSPMWPMLKRPLNDIEMDAIRRRLRHTSRWILPLQLLEARGEGALRRTNPKHKEMVWKDGILSGQVEQACSSVMFNIITGRVRKTLFYEGIGMEGSRIHIWHYGPAFPEDAAEAQAIAVELRSWYQLQPAP